MMWMIGSLLTLATRAQLTLHIQPIDSMNSAVLHTVPLKTNFKSRAELMHYVDALPGLLQARGYLACSVDNILESDRIVTAFVYVGQQYQWRSLRIDGADRPLLKTLGIETTNITAPATIAQLPQQIINYFQEHGYPFARVKIDSVRLDGAALEGKLQIEKGALYLLDSISVEGQVKISRQFLLRYLGIATGGMYQQSVLDQIDQKMLELPYLQQVQPWQLILHPNGYVLQFFLAAKHSNQVDALIGLLPSNPQNGGKLLLTVDAKLLLQNAFGAGEVIDLNWEQIQPKSPRLFLTYQQPYLFGSRFGSNLSFQLYKKDSAYLNIHGDLGVQYQVSANQSATVTLQTQRTNLLDIDTSAIKISRRLPDVVDLSINSIGVQYRYSLLDYRFNPRKGAEVVVTGSAGAKQVRRNNGITNLKDPSFNFNTLYDSLQQNSYQLRLQANLATYFPLRKQGVLKAALQGGLLQSPQLFRNEMFQLGGYRLLRGFDEESIYANQFAVGSLEYRYLLNLNSYLFAFADGGWAAFHSTTNKVSHVYLGTGLGMAFQAKTGIFNISYAVGKRNDLNFNLRQSKIHFGYLSFF